MAADGLGHSQHSSKHAGGCSLQLGPAGGSNLAEGLVQLLDHQRRHASCFSLRETVRSLIKVLGLRGLAGSPHRRVAIFIPICVCACTNASQGNIW